MSNSREISWMSVIDRAKKPIVSKVPALLLTPSLQIVPYLPTCQTGQGQAHQGSHPRRLEAENPSETGWPDDGPSLWPLMSPFALLMRGASQPTVCVPKAM